MATSVDRVDPEFIDRLPSSVMVIATYSAGYEDIDKRAAAAKNIGIDNAPGMNSNPTADSAILLSPGAWRSTC